MAYALRRSDALGDSRHEALTQWRFDLAGWNLTMGGLFKKKGKPARTLREPGVSASVQSAVMRDSARADMGVASPASFSMASDQSSGWSADRFAAMRAKLRLAFTPSQPVNDRRMFAGREDVLRTMIRAIEDQRLHAVLYGERGIGKTSLLHMLTEAAHEARYIVVYSSCGANTTFDEIFRAAAADIPLLFHSGFAPTTSEAERGSTLADLAQEVVAGQHSRVG